MSTVPSVSGEALPSSAEPGKIAYSISSFAAACGGLGRTFVYEEIKAGRLRAIKAGRRTLIEAAEARRWLSMLQPITAPDAPSETRAPGRRSNSQQSQDRDLECAP